MIAEKPWHINVSSKTIQISTDLKDQRSSNAFSYTEHDIWVYTLAQLLTAWISITCMWFVHQTKSVCLTHKGFLGVQILKGGLKRAVPDPSEIGWSTACWISCWLFYKKHFLNAEVLFHWERREKESHNEGKAFSGHVGCMRLNLCWGQTVCRWLHSC